MQDLEILDRLNARATAAEIPKLRDAGKFVVCAYSGLNYYNHAAFNSATEAQAYLDAQALENIPGARYQLLEPTVPAVAPVEALVITPVTIIPADVIAPVATNTTETSTDAALSATQEAEVAS